MPGIYRRLTNPLLVPVVTGSTGSQFMVPDGFIVSAASSFAVVNSNRCWVRLMGTSGMNPTFTAVTEGKGWMFPPGFFGVFATQVPVWMSALAVERDGFPLAGLTLMPLEVSYGEGA